MAEADDTLKALVSENRIWRQLCIYHFSQENIINTAIKLKEKQQEEQKRRKFHREPRAFHHLLRKDSGNKPETTTFDENKENLTSNNNNDNAENNNDSNEINNNSSEKVDWETVYKYLKRNFSLKEEYAEVLNYCKPCNVLFWPSFGHPCIVGESVFLDKDRETKDLLVDVKPGDFVSFFST